MGKKMATAYLNVIKPPFRLNKCALVLQCACVQTVIYHIIIITKVPSKNVEYNLAYVCHHHSYYPLEA